VEMSELIGQTLGPYRIIEQIGIGGMATVYKAYQPSMDRYVAIKVLPALVSRDPAFLKRFRREAKVVAKLEHKHVLPVHDYGEQEGLTYLVMRYVEAGTLKDRLAAGQLDLPAIYRIMSQVGAALDYAHRLGVIHRDVKPTNVLIDSQGDAYLTDFGLARIMESSEQLTATGVGVGTPAYMAPEQGQGLKIDHRSDIYSLGVMLYEMATGQVPYEAETPMAVVIKHITDPLPLPSSVKPDIPPRVERVILKAMAKDPDDRFQTVAEMVAALDAAVRVAQAEAPMEAAVGELAVAKEAALPSKGFLARAMAGVGQATQTGWGKTAMWAAVGIVALLAFFLALSRVPLKVQIRGGQLEVVRVVEVTITPEAAVPATTPVLSEVEGPTEAVAAGATATPTPLVTEGAPPVAAAPTPTLMGRIVYSDGKTGNDEIYMANSDGSDEQRLTDRPAGDWEPAWSPDGTRIVFDSDHHAIGGDRNQLYVMDADGSNLTRLTYTEGNEEHPSWSPDSSRIAFHSNGALAVINADGSNWTTLVEGRHDLCVQKPTWAPDSQRIAFRSLTPCGDQGPFQHDIYVVNDDGTELLKLATFTSEKRGWYVVWSPDGSRVAFDVELDGQQRYYAVNSDGSGEPVEIPSIPDSWYPWYWPQWASEEAVTAATPLPSMAEQARAFAEPILAAIADQPPDFEDDFSDPASGWNVGTLQNEWEDGERGYADREYFIIASPADGAGGHTCISGTHARQLIFSDFVLDVDGRFISGGVGDWQVQLREWWTGELEGEGKYSAGINADGVAYIHRSESGEVFDLVQGLPVKRDFETNSLRIVAVGSQFALYVNGAPALYVNDPGYTERFKAGRTKLLVCHKGVTPLRVHFDNLRIWDISDLALPPVEATPAPQPTATPTARLSVADQARAFAEPILAAIADRPPDYEDDFSTADRGWFTWIGKMGRPGDFAIEDGVAHFRLEQAELAMEHQALVQKDFVLQLDARLAAGDATSRMRVEFRVPLPEAGYKVELFSELGGWNLEWKQWGADQFQRIEGKGNVSPPGETTQITIVARGPKVAIYLNGTPVFHTEDAALDVAGRAYMMCHSLSETVCEFDNVKFWDISDLALP
jgi:predicted Ser/Thr protein kinase